MLRVIILAFLTLTLQVCCRPRRIGKNVVEQEIPLTENGKIPADKLLPPDHMDAVKMEQDGHLNKDFHKEAFLGEHEEIDKDPEDIAESKLKEIFHKVDTDKDDHLVEKELEQWISDKINAHISEAQKENDAIFKHLDPDGDGFVEWKEYYKHFLLAKGHNAEETDRFLVDYDADILRDNERDQLVRYKFRWTDADVSPIDNKLDAKEFFSFRHPEQSPQMIENMLNTILNTLDTNSDGKISLEEFIVNPHDLRDEDQEPPEKVQEEEKKERKKEFINVIDADKNGVASKEELKAYLDPRHPQQAKTEAANLISMMDDNKDKKLSMDEILKHRDIFISSKVVNVQKVLHDEF